ncbi:MAG: hydrolase [Anaerohalosphaera sp.]|nr:hydrolase [Anaerohalosphaera sp.]
MLKIEKTCLVVVDVQGKLAQLMHDRGALFANIEILIQSANVLELPIVACEQYPKALGHTIAQLAQHLDGVEPIDKFSFSCAGDERFVNQLKSTGRKQVLLCGIETHVCVYQTAMDLLASGYEVHLIVDAVSSRTAENKQIAIDRMASEGVKIASTEMVLFELMKTAKHPQFKQIAKLVK